MYVCMYACMYVCMYGYVYMVMFVCMCVCVYVSMYVCMHAFMRVCVSVSVHVYVYAYVYMYIVYVCVCFSDSICSIFKFNFPVRVKPVLWSHSPVTFVRVLPCFHHFPPPISDAAWQKKSCKPLRYQRYPRYMWVISYQLFAHFSPLASWDASTSAGAEV